MLDCIASGNLSSAACEKVLNTPAALLKLKEICQEPATGTRPCACCSTPSPALPALPGAASDQDPLSQLGDQVTGVLGSLGLGRSGTGPWNDAAHGGPTMAQLQTVYDPSLVNLLVPTLVAPADALSTGARRRRPE